MWEHEYVVRDDGKIALKDDGDPAIKRVLGTRRHMVGLDLGMKDQSAFVVALQEQLPIWDTGMRQVLGKPSHRIVAGDFLSSDSYHQLVQIVINLINDKALIRPKLLVDIGAAGRAFCDTLAEHPDYKKNMVRVQITSGEKSSNQHTHWNVARNKLIGDLQVAVATGDVVIDDFERRDQLKRELEAFIVKETASGTEKIEGRVGASHNDLALAAALALFGILEPGIAGSYGQRKLASAW